VPQAHSLHSLKEVSDQLRLYFKEIFAPNTQAKYASILNNFNRFLAENFSHIENITDINSDVFEKYKEERQQAQITPRTINAELIILAKFFDLIVDWHFLSNNPVRGIERLSIEKQKIPRFLSEEETKKLLENASQWLYPILFTFLNTGLRKHELENLEWDDVDLARRIIHVRAKDEWTPKEQEREIPVNDQLLKVLIDQKKKGIDSELVFPDDHRLKIHHNRLRRHLIRLAKKCEMPDVSQIHIFRHTFAARLIKRGVDLNTLRGLLGHNDIKTTMIYSHLKKTDAKSAVEELEF